MLNRLIGLETEFAIRYSPRRPQDRSTDRRPTNQTLCRAILDSLERLVRTAPGEHAEAPQFQRFIENGGAFSHDAPPNAPDNGPLEARTPECRGPAQLLLYQRAQEALIRRALAPAQARLAADGWHGEIAVLKNCRDADGNVYGTHENYEVEIARGLSLVIYRVGAALLVGLALFMWLLFWSVVLVFCSLALLIALFGVIVLLVFPLSRHWFNLEPYSSSESDGDRRAERVCELLAVWLFSVLFAPVPLLFAVLWRLAAFREIRSGATAFLVSRQVMTGAGTLNKDGTFALSERFDAIRRTTRCTLGRGRVIFETSNLLKILCMSSGGSVRRELTSLFGRRQRLHLGLSDSNCAQTAEYLKIGSTALVLDMAEAGYLADAPQLRDPISSIGDIARDPTLRCRVRVKRRHAMSAIDIQRWYLQRAHAFVSTRTVASLEARRIIRLWEDTLNSLQGDRSPLVGQIDWVTKWALIERAGRRLTPAARKKIDLKYHELGSGYLSQLEHAGLAPVLVSPAEVDAAVLAAPADTPAWVRGQAIRQGAAPGRQLIVSWKGVRDAAQRQRSSPEGAFRRGPSRRAAGDEPSGGSSPSWSNQPEVIAGGSRAARPESDTEWCKLVRVLVVDDDPGNVTRLRGLLTASGFKRVDSTCDPQEVQDLYARFRPHVILLNPQMPPLGGPALLEQLRAAGGRTVPPILWLGEPSHEAARDVLVPLLTEYLPWPYHRYDLVRATHRLLMRRMYSDKYQKFLEPRIRERIQSLDAVRDWLARIAEFEQAVCTEDASRVQRVTVLLTRELQLVSCGDEGIGADPQPIRRRIPEAILLKGLKTLRPEEQAAVKRHPAVIAELERMRGAMS